MRGFWCAVLGASLAALVGWFALSAVPSALSQEPDIELPPGAEEAEPEDGVDVQGRGAIHEAFAEPSDEPDEGYVVAKEPPQPVDELPPEDQPEGENITWINGYWMYDEDQEDFIWISGIWRDVPPGQRWVPGHWGEAEGGYQWVSGFWASEEQEEMEYLPAPPETLEQGPNVEAPGEDHFWIPGCWVHSPSGYRWRAGYYAPVRESWVWCPAHYVWTPSGYVFVDGYWDYRLPYRGVLFAPVCFRRPLYLTPGYCYTPRVCVATGPLMIHLFVRPRCRHYYYGDFYGDTYVGLGFHPWHVHACRPRCYDPLFVYYDWHYRRRGHSLNVVIGGWHVHYRNNAALRPPRAYVNNVTFINNAKVVNKTYVNNAVLTQNFKTVVNKKTNNEFNFKKVSDNQRQVMRKQAETVRDLGQQRRTLESKGGLAKLGAGGSGNNAVGKLNLPKVTKSTANSVGGGNSNARSNKAPDKPRPNQNNNGNNNGGNKNGTGNDPSGNKGNNNNDPNKGNNPRNNDSNKGGNTGNSNPRNNDPNKGGNNSGNNPNRGNNNNDPNKGGNKNPNLPGGNKGPTLPGGNKPPKLGGGSGGNNNPGTLPGGGGLKPPKSGGGGTLPGFNPPKSGGGSGGGRPPRQPNGGGGGGSGGRKDRR